MIALEPSVTAFIERLPELTAKGDRHRTKTHRHWWAPCDDCGEGMWLATNRLNLSCRMTPGCDGRHRKPIKGEK